MNNIEISIIELTEDFVMSEESFGVYVHQQRINISLPVDDYDPHSLFNGDLFLND